MATTSTGIPVDADKDIGDSSGLVILSSEVAATISGAVHGVLPFYSTELKEVARAKCDSKCNSVLANAACSRLSPVAGGWPEFERLFLIVCKIQRIYILETLKKNYSVFGLSNICSINQ